jgi:hypothetical protein
MAYVHGARDGAGHRQDNDGRQHVTQLRLL